MPFFGKPQEKLEAMENFTAKNGTGSKQEPEAIPIFGKPRTQPKAIPPEQVKQGKQAPEAMQNLEKPQTQPEALQILNSEKGI